MVARLVAMSSMPTLIAAPVPPSNALRPTRTLLTELTMLFAAPLAMSMRRSWLGRLRASAPQFCGLEPKYQLR